MRFEWGSNHFYGASTVLILRLATCGKERGDAYFTKSELESETGVSEARERPADFPLQADFFFRLSFLSNSLLVNVLDIACIHLRKIYWTMIPV